jgi:hypothetical protein
VQSERSGKLYEWQVKCTLYMALIPTLTDFRDEMKHFCQPYLGYVEIPTAPASWRLEREGGKQNVPRKFTLYGIDRIHIFLTTYAF